MLVSTNRTVVKVFPAQTITCTKPADRREGFVLQPFSPLETGFAAGERNQELANRGR